ncbi:MAG TPA: hypothetical protein VFC10_18355 [Terriglobia bacterium]|jgi:adenosylhomocysteine nucleosidase|nr:hypothetical protein [Terriglobia bacterium]
MEVLVTFAVDWEFKPWLRLRAFKPDPESRRVFRTKHGEADVKVLMTGMGPPNALRAVRESLDEVPDVCIVSGLAGSLKRSHRNCEILAARAVRSETGTEIIKSDETLMNMAMECGAKAVPQFISAEQVVRNTGEKSRLGLFADAVDMESFVTMRELGRLGTPCVAIRSVADSAEMDIPYDFDRALDGSGRIQIGRILGQVVRNPWHAWTLTRFGAQSIRAARSLAQFLDGYLAYLTAHKERLGSSVQYISQ